MIFLTVGTQLPFDRLVRAVDEWCAQSGRSDLFGQIAEPEANGYRPVHFEWQSFVEPDEFQHRFETADAVIAHAGMGTIISALALTKPLVVMPRRASLGEHRNDHQLATAERFDGRGSIRVVRDGEALSGAMATIHSESAGNELPLSPYADERLIAAVRAAIDGRR